MKLEEDKLYRAAVKKAKDRVLEILEKDFCDVSIHLFESALVFEGFAQYHILCGDPDPDKQNAALINLYDQAKAAALSGLESFRKNQIKKLN